jgi:hypothetical protein
MMEGVEATEGPLAVLRRWEAFGAKWRVLCHDPDGLILSLCRCDSDEEVNRLASADPELLAYIGNRITNEG